MTVSVTFTAEPAAPGHGDTVTAAYAVTGNDPGPPQSATVSGAATIGAGTFDVSTTISLPGVKPLPETFAVPSCPGLVFAADPADPSGATFTAVVP